MIMIFKQFEKGFLLLKYCFDPFDWMSTTYVRVLTKSKYLRVSERDVLGLLILAT